MAQRFLGGALDRALVVGLDEEEPRRRKPGLRQPWREEEAPRQDPHDGASLASEEQGRKLRGRRLARQIGVLGTEFMQACPQSAPRQMPVDLGQPECQFGTVRGP